MNSKVLSVHEKWPWPPHLLICVLGAVGFPRPKKEDHEAKPGSVTKLSFDFREEIKQD